MLSVELAKLCVLILQAHIGRVVYKISNNFIGVSSPLVVLNETGVIRRISKTLCTDIYWRPLRRIGLVVYKTALLPVMLLFNVR